VGGSGFFCGNLKKIANCLDGGGEGENFNNDIKFKGLILNLTI
jgi:hypothetical protein